MPSVSERLAKIIASHIPQKIVFKAYITPNENRRSSVVFEPKVVKSREVVEDGHDPELHKALSHNVTETWDYGENRFMVSTEVDGLWRTMKYDVISKYDQISTRSDATKRKTSRFIDGIKLSDKYLPDFIAQIFLKINSEAYKKMSQAEKQALFEQFEPLRRMYAK
jgi:hypothetical protein